MRGTAMHHVGGGDRVVPTDRVVYDEPKPKPRGLDWSKHTAPAPPAPEPPAVEVAAPKPPRQTRTKIRTPRPPAARKPRDPALRPLCECGRTRSPSARRCRECHFANPERSRRTGVVNLGVAISEYLAGSTIPEIAERYDWPVASIRKGLKRRRIPMRDDRAGHSGGVKKEYDPELVAQIRDLYESGLSQSRVADRLGLTTKIVQTIMTRHGIEARQGECGRGDTLSEYRERLAELGVTASLIRSWALAEGIEVHPRAMPPMAVIEAYAQSRGAAA